MPESAQDRTPTASSYFAVSKAAIAVILIIINQLVWLKNLNFKETTS